MNTFLPRHSRSAGFVRAAYLETLLLVYVVVAVLHLAFGHWKIAAAMLMPPAVLFVWGQYEAWRDRCKTGDVVQVILGPHEGMQGTIVGRDETGANFMVQPSAAEPAEPVKIHADHLIRVKRAEPEK